MPVKVTGWLLLSCFVPCGCVRSYRPPRDDEPHAIVKIRRSYEMTPGVSLSERVDVNGYRAYDNISPAGLGKAPRTDAILVTPSTVSLSVANGFFHVERRNVQENYTQQTPEYYTETYDCSTGFGMNRSYRTCTRPATRYKTEYKTRWVMKNVDVSDGTCERSVAFLPAVNGSYLLEYTYRDHGVCTLSCFEQRPNADGTFVNAPCPEARRTSD